jgi:hypothetical protein
VKPADRSALLTYLASHSPAASPLPPIATYRSCSGMCYPPHVVTYQDVAHVAGRSCGASDGSPCVTLQAPGALLIGFKRMVKAAFGGLTLQR